MNATTGAASSPSRVRHRVVALAGITYVDRVCIAQAAPRIQEDLGLSSSQLGMAFSAFALAYALFEIPGGWLGDRIGPRKVLMRIVVAWSAFTAATVYALGGVCWWWLDPVTPLREAKAGALSAEEAAE